MIFRLVDSETKQPLDLPTFSTLAKVKVHLKNYPPESPVDIQAKDGYGWSFLPYDPWAHFETVKP